MYVKFISSICCLLFCFLAAAQQKPTELDKSPMDMSYSPQNYPILKMDGKTTQPPTARVIYSRPQKNNREIFGGIVAYNQIWRLGANEATEIEFFKNVKIKDKNILKGRYTLYAICAPQKWTIIINADKDDWGLSYNAKKDVARIEVPVQKCDVVAEAFTIYFSDEKNSTNLNILWDDVKVALPISF